MKTGKLFIWLSFLTVVAVGVLAQSRGLRNPTFLGQMNVVSASFSPTNLSGCTLWLAADQAELSGYEDGQAATNWTDKSFHGYAFTNATGIDPPVFTNAAFVNGKPAILYTTNNFFRSTSRAISNYVGNSTMTIFYFSRHRPGSGPYLFYIDQNATNRLAARYTSGNLYFYHASTDAEGYANAGLATMTNNAWWLFEFSKTGTEHAYIHTNGVLFLDDTTASDELNGTLTANFFLPLSAPSVSALAGELAEIIFYDRALTDPERFSVRSYFTNKYGDWVND